MLLDKTIKAHRKLANLSTPVLYDLLQFTDYQMDHTIDKLTRVRLKVCEIMLTTELRARSQPVR